MQLSGVGVMPGVAVAELFEDRPASLGSAGVAVPVGEFPLEAGEEGLGGVVRGRAVCPTDWVSLSR